MSGSCFKQLVIVAVLFVAVAQFQGFAQLSSASVTGVVRDTSGSVIPGVKITLQNVATSVAHNTVSNTAGNYVFLGITPGEYTLQAEVTGFEVSKMPNARITTEIVLFDGQKKIEITNRLEKASSSYFVFPFAMDRPEFRYEIQNGVVNAPKDILPGGGMESFPVQHWASVEQDDVT